MSEYCATCGNYHELTTAGCPSPAAASGDDLLALVKEASEIMTITYAGNFPAGIESFLVRADRAMRAAASGVPAGESITLPVTSMRELGGQLQEMKHTLLSIATLIPPDISGKQPGDIFEPNELVGMVRKLVESRNG